MDPNAQGVQNNSPQANPSTSHLWIYITFIILATIVGISGYFIGFKQASSKKPIAASKTSPQSQPKLPAGLQKAQNLIKATSGSGLLTQTKIIQTYSGKLTSFVPEQTWTLENKGKTITINNETGKKINYFIRPGGPTVKSIAAKTALNLRTGDKVIIQTSFTAIKASKTNIDKITLVLPPPVSPSPSSKP